jgi:hypothetical protein
VLVKLDHPNGAVSFLEHMESSMNSRLHFVASGMAKYGDAPQETYEQRMDIAICIMVNGLCLRDDGSFDKLVRALGMKTEEGQNPNDPPEVADLELARSLDGLQMSTLIAMARVGFSRMAFNNIKDNIKEKKGDN